MTNSRINIKNWYSLNDPRTYISSPSTYKEKTVATNGHIVLFAPLSDYPKLPSDIENIIDSLMSYIEESGFMVLPELTFPESHTCKICGGTGKSSKTNCQECDGRGEIYFDNGYNFYELKCKSCEGDGLEYHDGGDEDCFKCLGKGICYKNDDYVWIDGKAFNPKYIKLICDEPDVKYTNIIPSYLLFKTGEYSGAIKALNV